MQKYNNINKKQQKHTIFNIFFAKNLASTD